MTTSVALQSIRAFRLTTADPTRLARFYAEGLGFSVGPDTCIPKDEMDLLGLQGGGSRLGLVLGRQRIDLDRFDILGRPYPEEASAADLIFQHFAIVVTDIDAAFRQATALGATPVSAAGPVKLPPSAGGVTAVKFRDPDGHPLEFLQFARPPAARREQGPHQGALGIDHSAISVADADASTLFYQALGLKPGPRMLNHGKAQATLDGLASPRVDVAPLQASDPTPHLELLGYRTPEGRPAPVLAANDIAATRIVWTSDRDELLRDPDGHLHLLQRQA